MVWSAAKPTKWNIRTCLPSRVCPRSANLHAPSIRILAGIVWLEPSRFDRWAEIITASCTLPSLGASLGRHHMAVTNRLWQSFVTVGGWSPHQASSSGRPTFGHHRSLSSILRSGSPKPSLSHSRSDSTTDSPMTTDAPRSLPSTPQPRRSFLSTSFDDENDMSTIPDPRSRAMSPDSVDSSSMVAPHHPDLDDEVATLSTKLINAINHQTTLDDNLSATRAELERSRHRIHHLEAQVKEQRELLAGDVWVRRKTVEADKTRLLARVAEEKRARLDMEQQKKRIEQELENLTTALFEEANKMVISAKEEARAEQEIVHRKNDQLKAQLADTEGLLKSQQEQLAELKHVMEQMTAEREEQSPPTVPSSPCFGDFDARDTTERPSTGSRHHHRHSLSVSLSPSYPTSFTHFLHPVLRTDLAAYGDFKELLRASRRLSGPRGPTGSSGSGLTSLGLGFGSSGSQVLPGNGSTTSLATTSSPPATTPQTPNTPASSISTSSSTTTPTLPHLKETKFYKRVLTEDIEPTLRLDMAPGLSWLARRSVLASIADGSLVVEPTPSTATGRFGKVTKPELYPCTLCGESRNDGEYLRTHRFRVNEADSTQAGYPLCRYCLARVRSTCEFLGFLRIVKDGHWRADDEDAEKAAWEESVRLREQMFWSRIGGGVVPTGHSRHPSGSSVIPSLRGEKSPRPSHDATPRIPEPAKQLSDPPKIPEPDHVEEFVEAVEHQSADAMEGVIATEATVVEKKPAPEPIVDRLADQLPDEPDARPAIETADSNPAPLQSTGFNQHLNERNAE